MMTMSKERLETIKELVKKIESILYNEWRQQELTNLIESLYYADHINWLINRVEELEEERDEWKDTAQSYYMTNQELKEQNKRYREAIERALDESGWGDEGNVLNKIISILNKVLEGEK